MTLRCDSFVQITASLRVRPYVYVTDATGLMFQGLELLFAGQTVPGTSDRVETFLDGKDGWVGRWIREKKEEEKI
jgi:hypothetical protein